MTLNSEVGLQSVNMYEHGKYTQIKSHFVQQLSFEHVGLDRHTHTHQTDCSTWTTKLMVSHGCPNVPCSSAYTFYFFHPSATFLV